MNTEQAYELVGGLIDLSRDHTDLSEAFLDLLMRQTKLISDLNMRIDKLEAQMVAMDQNCQVGKS